jgi:hypothetical protein
MEFNAFHSFKNTLIATCLLRRRKKIMLTSQPSGETTSEILPAPDSPSDQGKQN